MSRAADPHSCAWPQGCTATTRARAPPASHSTRRASSPRRAAAHCGGGGGPHTRGVNVLSAPPCAAKAVSTVAARASAVVSPLGPLQISYLQIE